MPVQPDIAGMLAKPNEESCDSVLRPIFDFDSIIINGLNCATIYGTVTKALDYARTRYIVVD